jgi:hypothetical protein
LVGGFMRARAQSFRRRWTGGAQPAVHLSILCLAAFGRPGAALAQKTGWVEIHYGTRRILGDYYDANTPRRVRGDRPVNGCLADQGDLCFGGDHEDQLCSFVPLCRTEDEVAGLLRDLKRVAESEPENAYAMGQAVYAFARLGRLIEAFQLAETCRAEAWWCSFLQGLVLQRAGEAERAESRFLDALATGDHALVCRLTDVAILLNGPDEGRYEEEPCETRDSLNTRFWWVSDPFFSIPGNDRWTEHIRRRFELVLHEQLLATTGNHHPDNHEIAVVRRGWEDSWVLGPRDRFVSLEAARYHFAPEGGAFSEALRGLTFRLEAERADEGFTPSYGPLLSLPAQIARFRDADSMVLAVAGTLVGSGMADASDPTAHLILSDGPTSFPIHLNSSFSDGVAVFLARTPPRVYLASYEVSSEDGMGRLRVGVDPLDGEGPGVSDLLLFRQTGIAVPDSLSVAAGTMLGETSVKAEEPLGVYWETYGSERDQALRIELEVRRERGGLMDAIRRLLPGGGEGGTGRLAWEEPSPGPEAGNSVILDVNSLEPGRYVLLLRVSWGSQGPLETERAFQIR